MRTDEAMHVEDLHATLTAKIKSDAEVIAGLRKENVKVSMHCVDLIQAMRDHGISDEAIKKIADEQAAGESK